MEDGSHPSYLAVSARGHAGQVGDDFDSPTSMPAEHGRHRVSDCSRVQTRSTAGHEHAFGAVDQARVDLVAGLAAVQGDVAVRSRGPRAASVGFSPSPHVGRIRDHHVETAVAKAEPAGRRRRSETRAPRRRAFSRATPMAAQRYVGSAYGDAPLEAQGHRNRARPAADVDDAGLRPAKRSAASTTCSVSGRGISTSGVTRNSRP